MPTRRLFPELAGEQFTLWYSHEKVSKGAWSVLLSGLTRQRAINEMTARQDVVRRNGSPCKFKALIEGERPER